VTVYLDTHVVAWLYAGRLDLIPEAARRRIDADEVAISPMVALELEYLYESGKVEEPAQPVLDALGTALGLRLCTLPFPSIAAAARGMSWTRDPFDRLIAAHAAAAGAVLVTKDRELREHYPAATWES
jgi:PIN domain nuclease of toxin-antitoxin system